MKLGILGGGQLGRMLSLAGIPLGVTCRVLDPSPVACAGAVAEHVVGEFEDFAALADFVRGLDVATFEFENVPVETAEWLSLRIPMYPPPRALAVAQDRLSEKVFFQSIGVPVPRYQAVLTRSEFDAAVNEIGFPCVLKTRRFGYDGKGQAVLRTSADAEPAWTLLGGRPLILEEYVAFECEASLIGVRGRDGQRAYYPLIENRHSNGILERSVAPAVAADELQALAEFHVAAALTALNYVGVLAVEFFVVDGRLLVNEMAPRVHNSGHWTIEGAETSQFENHVRAVVGWSLGGTTSYGASGMVNLIGDVPGAESVMALPGAHLHLYGKSPRAGRKLGHVTVVGRDRRQVSTVLDDVAKLPRS